MALASTGQPDFGAGIHRGREAPPNAVYDALNCLIDDEGQLFKRGGSAYHSSSDAGVTLSRVATGSFPGPATDRVLAWGTKLYAIDGSSPVELFDAGSFTLGRPVTVGGVMVWPYKQDTVIGSKVSQIVVYGGSLLPLGGDSGGGTITVTNGSTAVTKSGGPTWVGAIDPGMIVGVTGGSYGLVRSVDGANSLTLAYPYAGATATTTGYSIEPIQVRFIGNSLPPGIPASDTLALGSAGQRLLVGIGNRVYVADRSAAGPIFSFDPDLYHEIPTATDVTAIEGIGDNAAVFTTGGVWSINNLSFDLVDAYGNIQQSVERLNGDVRMWGGMGVTAWAGGILVAALDDVHILGRDGGSVTITGDAENEKVRRLYRSYTKTSGYQPGIPAVHRGHLFLPILNGSTVVDVLVCRLDRGAAWTRWSGHAAAAGFAVKAGTVSSASLLLGVNGQRVLDLTGTLDPAPSNASDADGTTSDLVVETRDYPTGQQPGFFKNARVRYELTDDGSGGTAAPTVALAFTSDQDAGVFTTLTERGQQGGGTGWGVSDGSSYQWALVAKKRERGRLRITVAGACASFVLRSVELLLRQSGKQ